MVSSLTLPTVILRAGHIQPVWAGHPWVYAQAVLRVEGEPEPGDEVAVVDPHGALLGRGLYHPRSAIAVRLLSRASGPAFDAAFFCERIGAALARRRMLGLPGEGTDAYRLVHAEGDDLPGLIVDIFADTCVVQMTTIGMKRRQGLIVEALSQVIGPRVILDRSPEEAARMEGFEAGAGALLGGDGGGGEGLWLRFRERGVRYAIPPELSQKTGFYLDQRPLRARVAQLSRGMRVLDAFSFVGAFGIGAALGGASAVLSVDKSALAVEVGAQIARDNGVGDRVVFAREDARDALAQAGREGGHDLVLCDPPKLAPTRASRDGALGAYRKLSALSARAVRPGGLLVFCSCSAAASPDALARALALGARDAGVSAVILERHSQGADHPVPAAFPEGLYLKSVIAQIGAR